MQINGFKITETKNKQTKIQNITIHNVSDLSPNGFDLQATFESGQCFRWRKLDEKKYAGIVKNKAVVISTNKSGDLIIENSTAEDFQNIWYSYFDFSKDYSDILKDVVKDEFMKKAVEFAGGGRVLNQEFEETLFSYIISAQNNIPRIKKLVEDLCTRFGKPIKSNSNVECFSGFEFPSSDILSKNLCQAKDGFENKCKANNLCGEQFAGYRCPYISRSAKMLSKGDFVPNYANLSSIDQDQARKELCVLPGVGEKVADCVLLYSGIRKDICPIDTWVAKTIKKIYLDESSSIKDIREFTRNYFGNNAGYAQLWFFYYARSGNLI